RVQQEKGAAEALEDVRRRLQAWDQRLSDEERLPAAAVPPELALRVGEMVVVERLGRQGQLVEIDGERQEAVVEVGAVRLRVPIASLLPGGQERAVERAGWSQLGAAKAQAISPELHLIGLRVDEALALLDKYLDDASLAGLQRVRIVHGKGTGSLRRAIHEVLAKQATVQHFALADAQAGGSGVTVIDL
ncbi:MAG: Smr/MutS family protein, partial [Sulfobacillus sp.]